METHIFSKFLDWILHPYSSENESGTVKDWIAGLALILIVAFLWSTVIKQLPEAV
jgi:hypothetical protein